MATILQYLVVEKYFELLICKSCLLSAICDLRPPSSADSETTPSSAPAPVADPSGCYVCYGWPTPDTDGSRMRSHIMSPNYLMANGYNHNLTLRWVRISNI